MAESWFFDPQLVRLRKQWVAAVRELGTLTSRTPAKERVAAERRAHRAADAYFEHVARLRRTRV